MRRIIVEKEDPDTIPFGDVNQSRPIFAKKHGELAGMIVKDDDGWILRIGGTAGATGYSKTLRECIMAGHVYDYEFFME